MEFDPVQREIELGNVEEEGVGSLYKFALRDISLYI